MASCCACSTLHAFITSISEILGAGTNCECLSARFMDSPRYPSGTFDNLMKSRAHELHDLAGDFDALHTSTQLCHPASVRLRPEGLDIVEPLGCFLGCHQRSPEIACGLFCSRNWLAPFSTPGEAIPRSLRRRLASLRPDSAAAPAPPRR